MADPFPDRSMAQKDKIAWMIETNGWALVPVAAVPGTDPPQPPFAYTVGLEQAFGFPEIIVFGLTGVASRGIVGLVVDALAQGAQIPIGAPFTGLLDRGLRCALLPVDTEGLEGMLDAAVAWYGGLTFRLLQMTWPDKQGWLPWEAGFAHHLDLAQPLIGEVPEE
jgi:hypothetical protein